MVDEANGHLNVLARLDEGRHGLANFKRLHADGQRLEVFGLVAGAVRATAVGKVAESAAGEYFPEQTLVVTAGQSDVCCQNGVASVDETGATGLGVHAVHDELNGEVVTGGHVAGVVAEAVLVGQRPVHIPEHRRPNGTDEVHAGRTVDVFEGERVDAHIGGVRVGTDAASVGVFTVDPGTDSPAHLPGIARFDARSERQEIAPSFAHLLRAAEATRLGRSTGEAVAYAVSVLVRDDPVVEVAVHLVGSGVFAGDEAHHQSFVDELAQELATRCADHHHGDGHLIAVRSRSHADKGVLEVADHYPDSTRFLGTQSLTTKFATAPVDESDVPLQTALVGDIFASVREGIDGVTHFDDRSGHRVGGDGSPPAGGLRSLDGTRRVGGFVHLQDAVGTRIPEEHLHPGIIAVGRGGEVGVVGAAAVLRVSVYGVSSDTAVAVVVFLEVTPRLVKGIVVEPVVQPVDAVKQLRLCGFAQFTRLHFVVVGINELQIRTPIHFIALRSIRIVQIEEYVSIVSARDREFGSVYPIGIVPAEGRSIQIPGVDEQFLIAVDRAFRREGEHEVLRRVAGREGELRRVQGVVVSPMIVFTKETTRGVVIAKVAVGGVVVLVDDRSRGGIDADAPVVGTIGHIQREIPRQRDAAVGQRLVAQAHGDGAVAVRTALVGEGAVRFAQETGQFHARQVEVRGGGYDGVRRRDARGGHTDALGKIRLEAFSDEIDGTIRQNGVIDDGIVDGNALVALIEEHFMRAGMAFGVLIGHDHIGDVGGFQSEFGMAKVQVRAGDVHRVLRSGSHGQDKQRKNCLRKSFDHNYLVDENECCGRSVDRSGLRRATNLPNPSGEQSNPWTRSRKYGGTLTKIPRYAGSHSPRTARCSPSCGRSDPYPSVLPRRHWRPDRSSAGHPGSERCWKTPPPEDWQSGRRRAVRSACRSRSSAACSDQGG